MPKLIGKIVNWNLAGSHSPLGRGSSQGLKFDVIIIYLNGNILIKVYGKSKILTYSSCYNKLI
jgi:hypothetical protein